MSSSPLYRLLNIHQRKGGRTVLDIDDLTLVRGAITGFSGPNGSGKSTLFSLLALLTPPDTGTLTVLGRDWQQLDLDKRRAITILPQDPCLLSRSVRDNVAYGLKIRGAKNMDSQIRDALSLVGLGSRFLSRRHDQLSGGEARRVALAARLVLRPRVLILDEPTSGVDADSARLIREAVLTARDRWSTSLLIASHDHRWLDQVCDHRFSLFRGRVLPGPAANLLFGPWERVNANQVRTRFGDDQTLTLSLNQDREPGTALLDPAALTICSPSMQKRTNGLNGRLLAIHAQGSSPDLLLEVGLGNGQLMVLAPVARVREQRLVPGDRIAVTVDAHAVFWLN